MQIKDMYPLNLFIYRGRGKKGGGGERTTAKQRAQKLTEAGTKTKKEYPHKHQNRTRLAFEPKYRSKK
jgi:hypothetical protein